MRYWPVYGGGETITVTLANELINRGYDVHIAYEIENKIEPMPYEIDKRIKHYKTTTTEKYKINDIHLLNNYIKENQINFIINQWGSTNLCYKAKKGTTCKLITCWHLDLLREPLLNYSTKDRIKKHLGKLYLCYNIYKQKQNHINNYNLSDYYVFLSPSFVDDFYKQCIVNKNDVKIKAISNPLTYKYNFNYEELYNKKKEVLFVGRFFNYHKRINLLLDIWKITNENEELKEWILRLVGDGPDMNIIKQYIKDKNIKNVSIEGYKNPKSYYEKASIFLMTSAFEGFGMTLVEAQQYGTVPIAMDSYSSLHDIIVNNYNGLIVKNNDIKDYSNKLKTLMTDNTFRNKLAINAISSCNKFSVDTIVEKWEKIFKQ
jgi:glycosyltransferase involved in cell wall biosynthesis